MERFDYVIIGGGVSGTTAAEVLREGDPHAAIAILESEPYPLYSKVKIPFYLKGKSSRGSLFLRELRDYADKNIGLYLSTKVAKVNFSKREVYAEDGRVFSYKKLLIASGGRPKPLTNFQFPISNFQAKILRMHTLDDADHIKNAMAEAASKNAFVVGENFIALEFAETFLLNDFEVTLLARGDLWGEARFGRSGAEILEDNFKKKGIKILTRAEPEVAFSPVAGSAIVGVGIGLVRNFEAVEGVEVGSPDGGGILTDEFLETSRPGVFAAGDAAEFYDAVAGKRRVVGNWTNSFLQGRAAALNILGKRIQFKAVSAYNIVNLGLQLAFVGTLDDADSFWERQAGMNLLRVFLKEGRIRGAVLINRFSDKIKIAQLIEKEATRDELEKTFS